MARVRTVGFKELYLKFSNTAPTNTTRRVREVMRRITKQIVEQAQRNAPVDWHAESHHELERSIHAEEIYDDNNRISIAIGTAPVVDGVDVDSYAMEMHEGLEYGGSGEYHLGPLSALKRALDPRNKVGGAFLTRAYNEYADKLLEEVKVAVINAINEG